MCDKLFTSGAAPVASCLVEDKKGECGEHLSFQPVLVWRSLSLVWAAGRHAVHPCVSAPTELQRSFPPVLASCRHEARDAGGGGQRRGGGAA